ncbi:MAG: type II toxin-antitoxin system CcdA family antitoxin [Sphingobium sp.]
MAEHDRKLAAGVRKATNVSLDTGVVDEAKRLGINISRACEEGLARQIAEARGRIWREENAGAMDAANAWVDRHGIPLARHRQF